MSTEERLARLEEMVHLLSRENEKQGQEIERLRTEVDELHGDAAVAWIERERVRSAFSERG